MSPLPDPGKQAAEVAYRMANILWHKGRAIQAIDLYRRAIALELAQLFPRSMLMQRASESTEHA